MLFDTRHDRIFLPHPGSSDMTMVVVLHVTHTASHYVLPMDKVEESLRRKPKVYQVLFNLVGEPALPSWGPVSSTPKTTEE